MSDVACRHSRKYVLDGALASIDDFADLILTK